MVSRCANPKCNRPFHSLKQGTLVVLPPMRHKLPERISPHDLAWLCAECALSFTVARSADGRIQVIGRSSRIKAVAA